MSDSLPNSDAVAAHVAAFERELRGRASARRRASRSATAISAARTASSPSWMQLIGGAPRRPEDEHRPLRQRAEAGDRGALDGVRGGARRTPRRPAPSTSRCPAAGRALGHRHPLTIVRDRMEEIFTRMGFADRRRARGRGRVALLRRAEHAGRAPRARHAGHAVPRDAAAARSSGDRRRPDAAAHAHLVDADPLHAGAPAADPHRRAGPRLPARRSRPDALADVRADGRARRRRRDLAGRSQGHAARLRARDVRRTVAAAVPPELLPLHRAERRSRHQLLAVRRRRLRDVQEDRLDRDRRLRHGAPGGVRGGRLRRRSATPASPGASASSASRSCATRSRTSGCFTRTICGSWNSFPY